MKNGFFIGMRPGEKIYINGAVVRVDRKVSLEFLNDVTFLLENHVMQPEQTTTPLRQLYFVVQTMVIDPGNAGNVRPMFEELIEVLATSYGNAEILAGLELVGDLVERGRLFEALKAIRTAFGVEDKIMACKSAGGEDTTKELEDTSCR